VQRHYSVSPKHSNSDEQTKKINNLSVEIMSLVRNWFIA